MTDECRIVSHGQPVHGPPHREGDQSRNGPVQGRVRRVTQPAASRAESTEGGIVQALGAVTPVWSLVPASALRDHGPLLPGDVAEITAATDTNLKGRKFQAAEHAVREDARHRMPVERQGSRQQQ